MEIHSNPLYPASAKYQSDLHAAIQRIYKDPLQQGYSCNVSHSLGSNKSIFVKKKGGMMCSMCTACISHKHNYDLMY